MGPGIYILKISLRRQIWKLLKIPKNDRKESGRSEGLGTEVRRGGAELSLRVLLQQEAALPVLCSFLSFLWLLERVSRSQVERPLDTLH